MTIASSPLVATGTPDYQGALRTENFTLLPGYGDDARYFAVPKSLQLARRGAAPDFFLEFVADPNGGAQTSLYAMLEMGLARASDLAEAYQLVKSLHPAATLMPATFTSDLFWHLECEDRHETAAFAWDDAFVARVYSRLDTRTGNLIYACLAGGTAVVLQSAVECALAAILPRVAASVAFDPATLLQALADLAPGSGSLAFNDLVAYCQIPHPGILSIEASAASPDPNLGLAVAGRIAKLFGQSAPCTRIADGPRLSFKPAPSPAQRLIWDLRSPTLAAVPVFLNFDPFTPVILAGDRDQVTAFTSIPALPLDQLSQRVTITSGLPSNIAGLQAIELTLRVAKEYSRSGAEYTQSVDLYPPPAGPRTSTRDLPYQHISPKPYLARLTVVTDDAVTEMPWVACAGDYLYIDSQWLPGQAITVSASAALLDQAELSATLEGPGRTWVAPLAPSAPAVTLLLPPGMAWDQARLLVTAQGPGPEATLSLELPCGSAALDLASFPQYGPQATPVTVAFPDGAQTAQFEFSPECGGASVVLAFSPAQASGQFSYFSTRLFQCRYRFRNYLENNDPSAAWSAYQAPGVPLRLAAAGTTP